MSLNKAILILVGVAVLCWGQAGTGTVTGQVFDSQTGRPVVAAAVAVNGQTQKSMVTDSDGRFTLQLTPGAYEL